MTKNHKCLFGPYIIRKTNGGGRMTPKRFCYYFKMFMTNEATVTFLLTKKHSCCQKTSTVSTEFFLKQKSSRNHQRIRDF